MDPIYSQGPRWERQLLRFSVGLFGLFVLTICAAALWATGQQDQSQPPTAPAQDQQLRLNIPARQAPTAPVAQPNTPEPAAETTAPSDPPAATVTTPPVVDAPAPTITEDPAPVAPPPAAPHTLHLIVTDQQASVDELALLPKGLTLVISATNDRLTDYVTFARHLGHSVLVAFPATKDNNHPTLMSPARSDQDNLARLQALLDEHTLIDGIKLYWHNPLSDREPLMAEAVKMISGRGLLLVGSNGPLMDQEQDWADGANAELIQIDNLAETPATLSQPAYGSRTETRTVYYATALTPNGQDELTDWAAQASRNGWALTPLKKQ